MDKSVNKGLLEGNKSGTKKLLEGNMLVNERLAKKEYTWMRIYILNSSCNKLYF